MTNPAIGDELYIHGDSNRDGSVRLLYGADVDGDGIPDATQQHRVGGRWVDMTVSSTGLAAGLATATVDYTAGATGAVARTPKSKGGDTISLRDFGGVTPSSTAVAVRTAAQQAIDWYSDTARGGITLDLGPSGSGAWTIDKALVLKSGVRVVGQGASTLLSNNDSDAAPEWRAAFVAGNVHPFAFLASNPVGETFASYAISDVAEGDTSVTCTTAGDSANFAVGDFVFVRTVENYVISTTENPSLMYLSKVTASSAGVVTLADRAPFALATATVCKVGGTDSYMGIPWYIAENCGVENMRIDARSPLIRGGCYNFTMRNVHNARLYASFLSLNAMVHSRFVHCKADWYYSWVELKMASRNTIIENCWGDWTSGSAFFYPISLGESSAGMTIRDCRLGFPASLSQNSYVLISLSQGKGFYILNNRFSLPSGITLGALVTVSGSSVANRITEDVQIRGNKMPTSTGISRALQIGAATPTFGPKDVWIGGNNMAGTLKSNVNECLWADNFTGLILEPNIMPAGSKMSVKAAGTRLQVAAQNWSA
jgi:hypothetical protein